MVRILLDPPAHPCPPLRDELLRMGKCKRRPWRVVIDNSIRRYGDCDHVGLHLLDLENITDIEDMHRRFPDKTEEEIVELTR